MKILRNGCNKEWMLKKMMLSVWLEKRKKGMEFVFIVMYAQNHTWAQDPQMTEPFCIFLQRLKNDATPLN